MKKKPAGATSSASEDLTQVNKIASALAKRLDTDPAFAKAVADAALKEDNAALAKLIEHPRGAVIEGHRAWAPNQETPELKITITVCVTFRGWTCCRTITIEINVKVS